MKIQELNNANKVPIDIDACIMFSSNKFELIHLTLSPGDSIDMHKNPFDVVFYMLNGTAKLSVDNECREIERNTSVFVDKSSIRGWQNNSNSNAIILVMKIL